jgi:hypothetical protein
MDAISIMACMSSDLKLTPEATVILSVLLNLIRLLGAELVAGEHRDRVDRVAAAILFKAGTTPLAEGTPEEAARVGVAEAKLLLQPIIEQIKIQAERAHLLDAPAPSTSVN